MKKKRTYSTESLSKFDVPSLISQLVALGTGCLIALDIAKEKLVFAVATLTGQVVSLYRFSHPTETRAFLDGVRRLRDELTTRDSSMRAVMEPTGTYGDAIRFQLERLGIDVHSISPKRMHDSQELFDGVPSMHDPKAAVQMARLWPVLQPPVWREKTPFRRDLRALIDRRALEERSFYALMGTIEGSLARHWPELGVHLDVHNQKSALALLANYPSPELVAKDMAEAAELLGRESRRALTQDTIKPLIESAGATHGVPMRPLERDLLSSAAEAALKHWRRADEIDVEIKTTIETDGSLCHLTRLLGAYTAAVLVAYVDPAASPSPRALEKACGLNLKVKSSGETAGRLSISKRGSGLVRQVLYLAALRLVTKDPIARAWYRRRKHYETGKQRAVVAVMRKLVKATWHVARGHVFDATKLEIEEPAANSREEKAPANESASKAHGHSARATDTGPRPGKSRLAHAGPSPQP